MISFSNHISIIRPNILICQVVLIKFFDYNFKTTAINGDIMIRLFELRTERELSQRDMAKAMNVSQGTYNNWENSNTQPSIEQLIALAKFFGVSVDYLIGNSDDFGQVNYEGLESGQGNFLRLYLAASPAVQSAIKTILEEYDKK